MSITMLTGNNSILTRVREASEENRYAKVMEEKQLWQAEKEINSYLSDEEVTTKENVITKLYNEGYLKEDEKDLLLAGETIYIAGKEVFFELEDGMLYLTLKVENSSENQYSIIYITPRIGGIPEIQSYEEYINPRQVLAGKTEAEKEQIFVDFEITNWGSYYESYYPGEEITLDLIL